MTELLQNTLKKYNYKWMTLITYSCQVFLYLGIIQEARQSVETLVTWFSFAWHTCSHTLTLTSLYKLISHFSIQDKTKFWQGVYVYICIPNYILSPLFEMLFLTSIWKSYYCLKFPLWIDVFWKYYLCP